MMRTLSGLEDLKKLILNDFKNVTNDKDFELLSINNKEWWYKNIEVNL